MQDTFNYFVLALKMKGNGLRENEHLDGFRTVSCLACQGGRLCGW